MTRAAPTAPTSTPKSKSTSAATGCARWWCSPMPTDAACAAPNAPAKSTTADSGPRSAREHVKQELLQVGDLGQTHRVFHRVLVPLHRVAERAQRVARGHRARQLDHRIEAAVSQKDWR